MLSAKIYHFYVYQKNEHVFHEAECVPRSLAAEAVRLTLLRSTMKHPSMSVMQRPAEDARASNNATKGIFSTKGQLEVSRIAALSQPKRFIRSLSVFPLICPPPEGEHQRLFCLLGRATASATGGVPAAPGGGVEGIYPRWRDAADPSPVAQPFSPAIWSPFRPDGYDVPPAPAGRPGGNDSCSKSDRQSSSAH